MLYKHSSNPHSSNPRSYSILHLIGLEIGSKEKPKVVRGDDYTVLDRSGAGKTVGVAHIFLTVIILMNPVVVVQSVSLIFSFDWMNAIALVVIIVGGMVIEVILIHIHDSRIWKQVIGYFRDFDECYFEPTAIETTNELEQGLKKLRDVFRLPLKLIPFLSHFLMPSIRAFYVCCKPPSWSPTELKTYHMAGGTSYIFLPQKPGKDFLARFCLLHEIGHAIVTNKIISVQGWFAVVYFCLLFVFVAFHHEAGILALLVAFALAAIWALYWNLTYYLEQQDNMEERLELVADAFALVHLAGRNAPDFCSDIARIARLFREESKWRYRAWLLEQRAQILSRPGTEFSLGWGQGINLFEQIVVPVPLWLGLLILAGMLWLGATLSIRDLQELLALSLVWVVVPALGHSYYMFLREELPYTARARRKAVDFLQAHAPEYDLRLMSVAATKDLLDVGRNLIIVALVGADLHIRIFDASGIKVIDKTENELIIDKTLTDLKNKKRLNPFHNESSLSKEEKQKIIRNAIFNLLFS
jgi:hypothetical protein